MRLRDWRRRTDRHRQQFLLRHATAVLGEQNLRVNFYAGGFAAKASVCM